MPLGAVAAIGALTALLSVSGLAARVTSAISLNATDSVDLAFES